MPVLWHFSLKSSTIKRAACDHFPLAINIGNAILEIDYKNNQYMVAGNTQFFLNNIKVFFSAIKTNDTICFCDNYIIFKENHTEYNDFFKQITHSQGNDSFFFTLPPKINEKHFVKINDTITAYTDVKQVIIECSSTTYMDSDSISAMLQLIKTARSEKYSLHFYLPNNKFISYLKLANIQKMVPVTTSKNSLEHLFKQEKTKDHEFILTNGIHKYHILSKKVHYAGRSKSICNIPIDDFSVSRVHAAIVKINNIIYMIDCGSTNGTYINNQKITPRSLYGLDINDTLVFGSSIRFSLQLEPD